MNSQLFTNFAKDFEKRVPLFLESDGRHFVHLLYAFNVGVVFERLFCFICYFLSFMLMFAKIIFYSENVCFP